MTEWADQKPILSAIRLAVKTGQRPTAMILRDKYAGYRDWDYPLWDVFCARDVDPAEWTDWDFTLASVAELISDFTNGHNGQLYWVDESEDVEWEVRHSYSGYDAALDREQKSRGELDPGESLYAIPIINENKPPKLMDWLKSLEEDARPPGAQGKHDGNDILNAIDDRDAKRKALADKLRRGEKP